MPRGPEHPPAPAPGRAKSGAQAQQRLTGPWCAHCRAPIGQWDRYCGNCGARNELRVPKPIHRSELGGSEADLAELLRSKGRVRPCPACDELNRMMAAFCRHCGHRLPSDLADTDSDEPPTMIRPAEPPPPLPIPEPITPLEERRYDSSARWHWLSLMGAIFVALMAAAMFGVIEYFSAGADRIQALFGNARPQAPAQPAGSFLPPPGSADTAGPAGEAPISPSPAPSPAITAPPPSPVEPDTPEAPAATE